MDTLVMCYADFERLVESIDRHIGEKWASGVDPDRLLVVLSQRDDARLEVCLSLEK